MEGQGEKKKADQKWMAYIYKTNFSKVLKALSYNIFSQPLS